MPIAAVNANRQIVVPALGMTPTGNADGPYRHGGLLERILATAPGNLIGAWAQNERGGTVSLDRSGQANKGAYTAVTLNSNTGPDGMPCANFDGSTSFNNIYSAALNTDFNPSEGTLMAWGKVSGAGVWTDGGQRELVTLRADANNLVRIFKAGANSQLSVAFAGSSTSRQFNKTAVSPTGFFCASITWSQVNNQVVGYYNAAPIAAAAAWPTWSGSLSTTSCAIGASSTTPLLIWSGLIAHVALWTTPLTAQQISNLAVF